MTYEQPPNPSKRCNFLKDALATCHTFCTKISFQTPDLEQEDDDVSDYDDEHQMEAKSKRKVGLTVDSFIWGFSPTELLPTKKETQHASDVEDMDEFYSSCSHLSRCSSATTAEAFKSVKTNLSRCSSTGSFEFPIFRRRRSIIRELCHCEGWPFGLCRKALLVPPLPKSPSESWLWRKTTRIIKIP
ncbi:hypothetical protein Ccrd_014989 [Cynara cardunculus var. scolymus]|uniref:Uncharacterized protein n=1 Tax=Cynara cardunculus var. scolymus TaxID=59895 RepID=A0A118K3X8_CYNCS|nr:hypothetical protein Ccrd_014989 [Cynara cardunculus var. scolymus]